jgi:hypothetical protein
MKSRCLLIAVLLATFSGVSPAASRVAASSYRLIGTSSSTVSATAFLFSTAQAGDHLDFNQSLAAIPMPEGSEKGMMVIGAIAILGAVKKKFWTR